MYAPCNAVTNIVRNAAPDPTRPDPTRPDPIVLIWSPPIHSVQLGTRASTATIVAPSPPASLVGMDGATPSRGQR